MQRLLKDPAAVMIVLTNMVPLVGVLFLGWSAYSVVWLYVLESFLIGFFNFWALLTVGHDFMKSGITPPKGLQQMPPNLFSAFFFCIHYGMFVGIQAIFVPILFHLNNMKGPFAMLVPPDGYTGSYLGYLLNPTGNPGQYITLLGLLVSHTFTFVYHYLYRSGNMRVTAQQLMSRPYKRVIVQQVVILLGAWLSQALGWGSAVILLFIGLKLVLDLLGHSKAQPEMPEDVPEVQAG